MFPIQINTLNERRMTMIPIIFDTDIGTDVDDALALVLAVNSPELNVLAITTLNGDVQLRGRIARKLLNLLGRKDIPVAAGCGRRFDGKEFAPYRVLGDHGFIETDQDGLPLVEEHAVDLMTRILQASTAKVTLVLVGPVTNAAEALKRYPAIKEKIERFVIMGGSISPNDLLKKEGWAKSVPGFFKASMEHNLNVDQAAADLILRSGIPILLVPAEMTFRTWLTEAERARLKESQAPQGEVLNRMCDEFLAMFRKTIAKMPVDKKFAQLYLHDPLTVTAVFKPDLITAEEFHIVPGRTLGVFRTLPRKNLPPNAKAMTDFDIIAFKQLFADRVFGVTLK
jgi:purine nucleosidase